MLLRAEEAENVERKDMTVTERAALTAAVQVVEAEKALARKAEAGRSAAPGRPAERSAPASGSLVTGDSRDLAVAAVGGTSRAKKCAASVAETFRGHGWMQPTHRVVSASYWTPSQKGGSISAEMFHPAPSAVGLFLALNGGVSVSPIPLGTID